MSFRREREMEPMVAAWLRGRGCLVIQGEVHIWHMCDMYGLRFAERTSHRIPAIEVGVAVELKLERFGEALSQAKSNRAGAHESWIAMPLGRINRMQSKTLDRCRVLGVGMLGVNEQGAVVVVSPVRVAAPGLIDVLKRRLWRRTKKQRMAERRGGE